MNSRLRNRLRMEHLEHRSLLAAGLIPLDLAIPLDQASEGSDVTVEGDATIKLRAMVLDPKAEDASDVSLTGYEFTGAGTFAGSLQGIPVTGDFATNPNPVGTTPNIPIEVHPETQTIDLLLTQEGTFTARTILGSEPGTFTVVVRATLDFVTHAIRGNILFTFRTATQVETSESPFNLDGALAADLEFPDASKPSLSGRVFSDDSDDGIRGDDELGVPNIRASRVAATDPRGAELEFVVTDANGYYAFYNLDSAATAIRFREVPTELDFGKMTTSKNPAVESVANSLDGITTPIAFDAELHRQRIDAALRMTPWEFQNPNLAGDVNNDGNVTAADALEIINLLSRLPAGVKVSALSDDREPGEAFYDADGNGIASAADALAVINAIPAAAAGGLASAESLPLEFDWRTHDSSRTRHSVDADPPTDSLLF